MADIVRGGRAALGRLCCDGDGLALLLRRAIWEVAKEPVSVADGRLSVLRGPQVRIGVRCRRLDFCHQAGSRSHQRPFSASAGCVAATDHAQNLLDLHELLGRIKRRIEARPTCRRVLGGNVVDRPDPGAVQHGDQANRSNALIHRIFREVEFRCGALR